MLYSTTAKMIVPKVPTNAMVAAGYVKLRTSQYDSNFPRMVEDLWGAMIEAGGEPVEVVPIFDRNITHNLNKMAEAAGIYMQLWRPDEIGVTKASEIIEPLKEGLNELLTRPEYYKKYDSSNGWGVYPDFVEFVQAVLAACEQNPDARIEVSR
jgi:hypothetical protein